MECQNSFLCPIEEGRWNIQFLGVSIGDSPIDTFKKWLLIPPSLQYVAYLIKVIISIFVSCHSCCVIFQSKFSSSQNSVCHRLCSIFLLFFQHTSRFFFCFNYTGGCNNQRLYNRHFCALFSGFFEESTQYYNKMSFLEMLVAHS